MNKKAAIYLGGNFDEEIAEFSVFKVRAVPKARTANVPLENGQAAFDNRVIDPMEVSVSCKISRFDRNGNAVTNRRVNDLVNAQSMYSVTDGMDFASGGLILKSAPYDREPSEFDVAIVEFVFERPIIARPHTRESFNDNSDFVRTGYVHGVSQ